MAIIYNFGLSKNERKSKVRNTKNKPIDKDGYPIKRWEICFRCGKKFCLAFSFSQQNYSLKNFWNYWSENEDDKGKFIDNFCLRDYYLDPENRKELSPRRKYYLSPYLSRGMLLN